MILGEDMIPSTCGMGSRGSLRSNSTLRKPSMSLRLSYDAFNVRTVTFGNEDSSNEATQFQAKMKE